MSLEWRSLPLALLLLGSCAGRQAAPPRPPNILMIVGDDQGWTDFGFMEIGRAHV